MIKIRRLLISLCMLSPIATSALAAQPYEGAWCEDGSQEVDISRATFWLRDFGSDGDGECQIKSVTNPEKNTWHFAVLCGGKAAKYSLQLAPDGKKAVMSKFGPDYTPLDLERCSQ